MDKYNRILNVLEERGTSQAWLAKKVGISRTAMNSICHNRSQPRFETLYKIAEVLDVDVCDLLVRNKSEE